MRYSSTRPCEVSGLRPRAAHTLLLLGAGRVPVLLDRGRVALRRPGRAVFVADRSETGIFPSTPGVSSPLRVAQGGGGSDVDVWIGGKNG